MPRKNIRCPLCNSISEYTETWTDKSGNVISDYRCHSHLTQHILPEDSLATLVLGDDGDELYQIYVDKNYGIIQILDWCTGNSLDLEGTGVRR